MTQGNSQGTKEGGHRTFQLEPQSTLRYIGSGFSET